MKNKPDARQREKWRNAGALGTIEATQRPEAEVFRTFEGNNSHVIEIPQDGTKTTLKGFMKFIDNYKQSVKDPYYPGYFEIILKTPAISPERLTKYYQIISKGSITHRRVYDQLGIKDETYEAGVVSGELWLLNDLGVLDYSYHQESDGTSFTYSWGGISLEDAKLLTGSTSIGAPIIKKILEKAKDGELIPMEDIRSDTTQLSKGLGAFRFAQLVSAGILKSTSQQGVFQSGDDILQLQGVFKLANHMKPKEKTSDGDSGGNYGNNYGSRSGLYR